MGEESVGVGRVVQENMSINPFANLRTWLQPRFEAIGQSFATLKTQATNIWVTVRTIEMGVLQMSRQLSEQQTATKGLEMTVSQLADTLTAVADKLDKVKAEVQKLKDSLSDVTLPQAAQDALARLSKTVQDVDDINVDEA